MTEAVVSSFMQELADSRRRDNVNAAYNFSYEKDKEESALDIKVEEFNIPTCIEEPLAGTETKVIFRVNEICMRKLFCFNDSSRHVSSIV